MPAGASARAAPSSKTPAMRTPPENGLSPILASAR